MADNLKLQQDINKAIAERNKMLTDGEAIIQRQAKLYATLLDVIAGKKGSEAIDEMIKKLDTAKASMQQMAEGAAASADKTSKSFNVTEKDIDRLFGSSKTLSQHMSTKFPKAFVIASAAATGLAQGFKNVLAVSKSLIGITGSVIGGMLKIGKSILAIPFKIFGGLIEKAQAGGGGNELAQAFEDVRKEFGSFKQDAAKNVIGAARSMEGELGKTGLSVWKVFGNLAERIKYVTELAKGMGPTFHLLGTEIKNNVENIGAYQKGLGLSSEEMQGVGQRAIAMGTTLQDQLQDVANMSLQMGESFGLSAKMISRDVGKMIKDVKNFGSLTVKEMTEASVFTKKLGLEVNKLLGLIDKFDTFEGAAESAAKLSQAFGVNVNAFEMMKEQNPAKRLDELRKSFQLAGKSAENLSRQELKLISDATGLDEETAKLALSSKNAGVSMDDIKKKSDGASKKTLTQAETMGKLADAIERLVLSGGPQGFKGFFDAFTKGIGQGIQSSPEFIKLMMDIRRSLMQVFQSGVELGRYIVKTFPGIKEIFKGLAESVRTIPDFFRKMSEEIKGFLSGKLSLGEFFDNMKVIVKTRLEGNSGIFSMILEGFKKTLFKLGDIIAKGIAFVIPKLTEGLKRATEFLKNPKEFIASAKGSASSGMQFVLAVLDPIIKAVKDEKMWEDLWKAFKDFAPVLWKKLKKVFFDVLKAVPSGFWLSMGAVFFGPIVGKTFLGIGSTLVGEGLKNVLFSAAKEAPKIAGEAGKAAASGGGALSKLIMPVLGNPYVAAAAAIAAIAVVGVGFSKGVEKFQAQAEKDLGGDKKNAKIASAVGGIIQMFSFGAVGDEAAGLMVKNIGEFAQTFDKTIEKLFGKNMAKDIKERMMAQFDALIDVGDFLRSLFSGDISGAGKALGNLVVDIWRIVLSNLKFVFLTLPEKMVDWLGSAVDALTNWLDSLFQESGGTSIITTFKVGFASIAEKIWPIISDVIPRLTSMLFMKIPAIFIRLSTSIVGLFFKLPGLIFDALAWIATAILGPNNPITPVFKAISGAFKELGNDISFMGKYAAKVLENFAYVMKEHKLPPGGIFPNMKEERKKFNAEISGAAKDAVEGKKEINQALAAVPPAEETKKPEAKARFRATLTADPGEFVEKANETMKGIGTLKQSVAALSVDDLKKLQTKVNSLVDALGGPEELGKQVTILNAASGIFESLASVAQSISKVNAVKFDPAYVTTVIGQIKTVKDSIVALTIEKGDVDKLESTNQAFSQLSDIAAQSKAIAKSLQGDGAKSLQVIVDIVKSSQTLNTELERMVAKPLEIKTRLQELANKLGMGASGRYEIKNNGIEIKLNLQVTMDAGKVEEVIVRRSDSKIRKTFEAGGMKDVQTLNNNLGTPR